MFNRNDFSDELNDLRKDVAKLREDAAALFASFMEAGRGETHRVRGNILHNTEEWLDEVRDRLRDARRKGADHLSGLADAVSAKPLVSVALAIGVGALLAHLIRRPPCE